MALKLKSVGINSSGMVVIADYADPVNNQRTLVLERQGAAEPKKRTAKPKLAAGPPEA